MDYEQRVRDLGIVLTAPSAPAGSYKPVVICGQTAYLSGQLSKTSDGKIIEGRVGENLSLADGQKAARAAALNVLSLIRSIIGFGRFERILRVVGYVQCAASFHEIPQVINGASDLFLEVFGDNGIHARSAVGMSALPFNSAVEIEVTAAVNQG